MAFDKTSPIEATISVLGMSSVSGYIDKSRLMFFGRLCNSEIGLFHKDIFTNAIAEHSLGFTNICHITKSLINTLLKYDLVEFLHNYIISGYFPPKHIWNNIVKHAIREREEHLWTVNSGARPELSRFVQIQRKLKPNNLLLLSYIFPEYTKDIINVLKIASCPKMNAKCYMCDRDVEDIILHISVSGKSTYGQSTLVPVLNCQDSFKSKENSNQTIYSSLAIYSQSTQKILLMF